MSGNKKPRKKYVPKNRTTPDTLSIFGGMSDRHADKLQTINVINHTAMQAMAQGRGDKNSWDRLVGMVNLAIVMSEQGIGPEFRDYFIAGREALLACGKRSVKNNYRFLFTGDELQAMNEALAHHEAQIENVRAIDLDRALDEVQRRLDNRINSTSVMAEIRKENHEDTAQTV